MGLRRRRGKGIVPRIRVTDYATNQAARSGLPLALELLAILAVILAVLMLTS